MKNIGSFSVDVDKLMCPSWNKLKTKASSNIYDYLRKLKGLKIEV